MAAAKSTPALSRQNVCRKLVSLLTRHYSGKVPPPVERPILQSLIFGICLEDSTFEQAQSAVERLDSDFHDYNEARVSSISELERVFDKSVAPEWKALRVRNTLTYVFESFYVFEYESLRRKTVAQATRMLGRIPQLSHFPRNFTLQQTLDTHVVPLDMKMKNTAAWLGLVQKSHSPQRAGRSLQSIVRKADTEKFCGLLRCLATDEQIGETFGPNGVAPPTGDRTLATAHDRLRELFTDSAKAARIKAAAELQAQKKGKKTVGKAAEKTAKTAVKEAGKKVARTTSGTAAGAARKPSGKSTKPPAGKAGGKTGEAS